MKIIKDKTAKLSFVALLITCIAAMFYTPNTKADQTINMDNGMVCFQTDSGHIYGCHGGVRMDNGFNDVETGTRYEINGNDRTVDTRTGQSFDYPVDEYMDDYE